LDDAPCALVTFGADGMIMLINSRAERLFGVERHRLIGRSVDQVLPAEGGAPPWDREPLPGTELDLSARHSDGSRFRVAISLSRTDVGDERLTSVAVRDVTECKLAAETLAHRASHDPLTGLPNRSLFLDRLEHALARKRRSHGRLAVLFLDLDGFKVINDTRGHDVGDLLLRALAPRLSAALRPGDTIARFGGDEFVVLCEDLADEDAAVRIAQRLAAACSRPLVIGETEHVITVSTGIALLREGQDASASALLKSADAAMYNAKAGEADRIEVFDDGMGSKLLERIGIEYDLRRALERNELRLLYHPVMSLRGETIVGVEALLRWQHPTRGLLEPAEFIDVAESSGLIVAIGGWVILEACRAAAAWRAAAPQRRPVYVSVNLSRQQVVRSDVAGTVARSLRATRLDPALLELEITEAILFDDLGACALAVRGLKAVGARVVLDNFGAGYSSLRYLKRLRIDALKIDPSFVDGFESGTEDVAVVGAVLSMARALEVRVTAEGVETPAQLGRLREQGCDFAQGYLFARPGTADRVLELLLAGGPAHGLGAKGA
jgi:diguanylate cyclase (GGDEF)-like protein/PAS domain S-box-containing protein